APKTIPLRAQRVRNIVPRRDDVVELPDRAVFAHARDRIVDVELSGDAFGGDELLFPVETRRVDDLVFLRDLDLFRVDLEVALFGREHNVPIEPDALGFVAVRLLVVALFDRAEASAGFLWSGLSALDLPQALGRFDFVGHAQEPTPLAAELRSIGT